MVTLEVAWLVLLLPVVTEAVLMPLPTGLASVPRVRGGVVGGLMTVVL